MQSTNELVEEAKKKRTLASLKPTALPESQNAINTEEQNKSNVHQPEIKHSVMRLLPEKPKNQIEINTALPENHNTIKKVKVTVYITEEAWEDFNYIYGKRILQKRKTDKGDLMTEAIELLKQKEDAIIP